jgi:hypothetical protein
MREKPDVRLLYHLVFVSEYGVHTAPDVTVECLHRGHVAVLTRECLPRPANAPNAPVVKFVKPPRVRKLRCIHS